MSKSYKILLPKGIEIDYDRVASGIVTYTGTTSSNKITVQNGHNLRRDFSVPTMRTIVQNLVLDGYDKDQVHQIMDSEFAGFLYEAEISEEEYRSYYNKAKNRLDTQNSDLWKLINKE